MSLYEGREFSLRLLQEHILAKGPLGSKILKKKLIKVKKTKISHYMCLSLSEVFFSLLKVQGCHMLYSEIPSDPIRSISHQTVSIGIRLVSSQVETPPCSFTQLSLL